MSERCCIFICGNAERMSERYYILFENYEQGLALHDLLDEAGVMNRIAPAPSAARGTLCCGMSLLVGPDMIGRAKEVISRENAVYHSIVSMENPLQPMRDRYC